MTTLKSINPATEELFAEFKEIDLLSTEEIIEKSSNSQKQWSSVNIEKRIKIISEIADFVKENKESFGKIITNEMGKPIIESIAEVEKCVWLCEYYADNGINFLAEQNINSDADRSFVSFEPLGVILGVMPWNFPFWQVFRFAVPSLTSGNGVILKHASNVQGCAFAIESLFLEAGFPDNVFRNISISGKNVKNVIKNTQPSSIIGLSA